MSGPFISIIMPSYNQKTYLDKAIQSILTQNYDRFELIVIDGGSRDGSADVIRQYSDRLAHWESEPDRGQSHALNKGFAKAKGDLLAWVNSDDLLMPGALKRVAQTYSRLNDARKAWIIGGCLWIDPQDSVLRCTRARRWCAPLARRGKVTVFGPSSFFASELLRQVGPINESLHYMMDTELWMRFVRHGAIQTRVPGYLWALRLHPEAKMSGHNFADSPMASTDHPVWRKRQAERDFIRNQYSLTPQSERTGNWLSKIQALCSLQTMLGRWDTFRRRGRTMNDYFRRDYPRHERTM